MHDNIKLVSNNHQGDVTNFYFVTLIVCVDTCWEILCKGPYIIGKKLVFVVMEKVIQKSTLQIRKQLHVGFGQGSQVRSHISIIKWDMDGWDVYHLISCMSKHTDEKEDFEWQHYLFDDRQRNRESDIFYTI